MNYFVSLHEILREVSNLTRFMRQYFIALVALLLLMASCGGNKTAPAGEATADSVVATDSDSLVTDELVDEVDNLPMPKAADELFDDFIFNFASSKKLQFERILFPLKSYNGDKVETITRQQWKMDYFFMRQQYYTLLFDSERHMEIVKDTTVNHAVVEKIYFNTHSVIQYVFDRLHGVWMLTRINTIPIIASSNATFLDFYQHFATDADFQRQHLAAAVIFVGPDPDDDFAQMEGVISPDTWEAFAPELPTKMIYNIIYGQPEREGDCKVFVLRGIANGMEVQMTFRRTYGRWKLTKLTT